MSPPASLEHAGLSPRSVFCVTTLIAWAAVDQRRVSSIYIASDSRISWGSSHLWDQGCKTFAAAETPHIFGYWGDVLFPSIALPTVLDQLAASAISPTSSGFSAIGGAIQSLWTDYPKPEKRDFGIVMATRRGRGMEAVFELGIMTFEASTETWDIREADMPESSSQLHLAGSGSTEVRKAWHLWEDSSQGGTSRAIYSAFAEALAEGKDPRSGGGPQLVALQQTGPGRRFGTVYQGKRYLAGAQIQESAARATAVNWFNELFERVDGGDGRRLVNAQRHAPRRSKRA